MMARAENNQITIDGLYKKNIVSSPEMSDMQYNCVNSIDYSSGQPDIRIPLFEIECGTLKLPIYLSYKSSGVKISEPSGWVGQNWTLHAEPAISRMPKMCLRWLCTPPSDMRPMMCRALPFALASSMALM